jgi:hypothetical protein
MHKTKREKERKKKETKPRGREKRAIAVKKNTKAKTLK